MKILTIMPSYEPATYYWSQCLLTLLNKGIIKVPVDHVMLYASDATPNKVYTALQDSDVVGVSGLGAAHGNNCIVVVQNEATLFQCGDDKCKLLKGKYWNQVSCLVGNGLLQYMVSQGLAVGLGQTIDYFFVTYGGYNGWENDPTASFIKANWAFDYALLSGYTAKEAYEIMLNAYEEEAKKWDVNDPEVAYYLRLDAKYRQLFGDPNYKVPGAPPQPPPTPPQPPRPRSGTYDGTFTGTATGTASGYVVWGKQQRQIVIDNIQLTINGKSSGQWSESQGQSAGINATYIGKSTGTAVGNATGYMKLGMLRVPIVIENITITINTDDKGEVSG